MSSTSLLLVLVGALLLSINAEASNEAHTRKLLAPRFPDLFPISGPPTGRGSSQASKKGPSSDDSDEPKAVKPLVKTAPPKVEAPPKTTKDGDFFGGDLFKPASNKPKPQVDVKPEPPKVDAAPKVESASKSEDKPAKTDDFFSDDFFKPKKTEEKKAAPKEEPKADVKPDIPKVDVPVKTDKNVVKPVLPKVDEKPKTDDKAKTGDKVDAQAPTALVDKLQSAINSASTSAAATVIVDAGRKGRGSSTATAAATGIVDLFGKGRTDTLAEAFAFAAARDTAATAAVFAKAAVESRRRGYEQNFARGCARGFVKARSTGDLNAYTIAVSKAIADSDDDDVVQAYGVAFAEAVASGGEDSDALAEATAIAFCSGGSTATAFAKAYSVALSRNKNGCLVLTKAKAIAVAQCSGGTFKAYAEASVERKVLGLCGILEQFGIDFDNGFRR